MLLPSGPANTRCSVCRCATQPGARNGFAEPRDRQPKSTLSRPQPAAETAGPAFEPRKRPQIAGYSSETGKHRFASDCVVVDAARIEPVSPPNSLPYRDSLKNPRSA